jgi:hypothetical protein
MMSSLHQSPLSRVVSEYEMRAGRFCGQKKLSTVGQLTAFDQSGPNDVPAHSQQPCGLQLVAMAEAVGRSHDRCLNLVV